MGSTLSLTGRRWNSTPNAYERHTASLTRDLLIERDLDHALTKNVTELFPDIQTAAKRIHSALEAKETIGIFGDYDCDGITAALQLVRFFRRRGVNPVVKLPHRVHEGYGLHSNTINWFREQGVTLLITVDTGITAVSEIAQAKEHGIDVIITDHHQPTEQLPQAHAIIHPIVAQNFPQPHPAGAGVAFALIHALENGEWEGKDEDEALAMIGTVADLVELRGMNRRLVKRGLERLQTLRHCPLADLRDRTHTSTSTDVAFRIAPRVNAAGRIDDPHIALRALLDGGDALEALETLNESRQAMTHALFDELSTTIDTTAPLLWSASEAYHPGIVGLLAGRLTERYGKPSCVVHVGKEACTASLRSPSTYHITQGLTRVGNLLTRFGGHAAAAGCTVTPDNLDGLRRALTRDIEDTVDPESFTPELTIDAVLNASDLSINLVRDLGALEPFGQGNPEPCILLQGVHLADARLVGSDRTHLQCSVEGTKAIGFRMAELLPHTTKKVDVACRLRIDSWNETENLQLHIEDLRISTQERASLPSRIHR